jgi:hypothetical protein
MKTLIAVVLGVMMGNGSAASSERIHIDDTKLQYCYGYIKQLKGLWFDIHQDGVEETMRKHPPESEGTNPAYAQKLAAEIETVDKTHAQEWIEMKWNECLDHPEGVGK